MTIGGEPTIVQHIDPLFASLAPDIGDVEEAHAVGARGQERR
jgi:hypothetical protein